ncbi:hypothetical protein SAMN06265367_101543 [Algoriphagus winogradskyi]|uniref:Outer membrane protein beta-barrel domain-containing protein n=2 Tax=Algoriphagus winogradskyi TaxID=237017 RepID=A0ABY1NDG2_9BACT|nr:hypothetical protein SAMN06265367_101543 [Algoriphagus winogradskyi]
MFGLNGLSDCRIGKLEDWKIWVRSWKVVRLESDYSSLKHPKITDNYLINNLLVKQPKESLVLKKISSNSINQLLNFLYMKSHRLLLILFFFAFTPIFTNAQEKPKLQYTVGLGSSIDGMNDLYGLNFSNELNVRLGKRTSFNTSLSFYQSLGSYNEKTLPTYSSGKNEEQSSGIFITPSFKYDIIQRPSGFNLAFSAGPSLQLGGETFIRSDPFSSETTSTAYITNKYQRVGLFMELEAEWNSKNPNRKNVVSLSAFGANNAMPWYLNATYKMRFKVGKK